MSLTDALILYRDSGIYPFHMPGHKRNSFTYGFYADCGTDITEIDGFDNLHDANGILKDGMKKAAHLYGSQHTFYLVNGSTCGILTGISACTNRGDRILVARNCHKSVYNAIEINGLDPVYILPQTVNELGICGSISPESIEKALEQSPEIKLIIITSPTYEGVVSDINRIADIAHKKNIPLFVDEAHGAHFGFTEGFPANSVSKGADIVVHSLHKTLPSPTQTALLHINGNIADITTVRRELSVFETSSPSYILMAGIDSCLEMLSKHSKTLFNEYKKRLKCFYDKVSGLKKIYLFCGDGDSAVFGFDPGKIVISVRNAGITGTELKDILLDKYLLQLEMATVDYAIAMTSICDTDDGFDRLAKALNEIEETLDFVPCDNKEQAPELPERVMPVSDSRRQSGHFVEISSALGEISREYIYAYPPGIPLIVPGERITKSIIGQILALTSKGVKLKSDFSRIPREINVVS